MFENLLSRGQIGNVELKNRFFKAAAQDYPTYDGYVTRDLIDFCGEQARGGVALVITGLFNVNNHESEARTAHPRNDNFSRIAGMTALANSIKNNGAKACLQLAHYGSHGEPEDPEYGWRCVSYDGVENEHWFPLLFPQFAGQPYPHKEYTKEEITELVNNYGDGALRAKMAGFDMIEVHCGNMHGLNTWLTPRMNHRTDEYGGSRENRCRILFEIIENIQLKCGKRFPIIVRLNAADIAPGGYDVNECAWIAHELELKGVSAINLAYMRSGAPMQAPMGEVLPFAKTVKDAISIPLMVCGSMNLPEMGEKAIAEGELDYVGFARALYADPELPKKVLEQRPEDIRPCLRCNECLNMNRSAFHGNLECSMNPQLGIAQRYPIVKTENPKKVAVIGAGPAGLEAALISAQKGHKVTLFEKRKLGGLVNEASTPVFKGDLKRLLKYFEVQLKKQGVEVRYEEATPASVGGFDAAIVCTGSQKNTLKVPGVENKNVINAIDWISVQETKGNDVVIIGGGSVGVEVALTNAMAGRKVTIVEVAPEIMAGELMETRFIYIGMLQQFGVRVLTNAKLISIQEDSVTVEAEGVNENITASDVMLSVGLRKDLTFRDELDKIDGLKVYYAGDCEKPRLIFDAIHAGFAAAQQID